MPTDEVQQREEIDPDDVDEVPVEAEVFDECDVAGGVGTGSGSEDHEHENTDSDDHVEGVHAGHGEIEEEVEFGVPGHVVRQRLILVFLVDFGVALWVKERLHAVMEARDVMLLDLLSILDGLNTKEDETEYEGNGEAEKERALLLHLSGPHGHGHGE